MRRSRPLARLSAFTRPLRRAVLLLPVVLALASAGAFALSVDEDAMKAVYIFKFLKFVEWPESTFTRADQPFRLCVAGEERLGAFAGALERKGFRDRAIQLVDVAKKGEIGACHLIFISSAEAWRLKDILSEVDTRPVLTISDIPRFVQQGGMIEFVFDNDRLGFAINERSAQRARLYLSSQLLNLAKAVITKE